uniref:Uncharacterized protein n=1 Tax=Ananas comosus var. bracteatus TaxID=296719 RepID=A0A6V7NLQ0_ANACO|nr:unnamed protein product [Ananas comosus var. bracteatus]
MEALSRSEQVGMVPSPSPKLEDFLGSGPNMGTHHDHYGNNNHNHNNNNNNSSSSNDRGSTMALSLDSMYYHQTQFMIPPNPPSTPPTTPIFPTTARRCVLCSGRP